MGSIAILSGNHLCHNPRVVKEAAALSDAGHEVTVFGAWFDAALKRRDQSLLEAASFQFVPVVDLAEHGFSLQWSRFRHRARAKAAQLAFQYFGLESSSQLGFAAAALGEAAFRKKADLYIAHSEAGLAAASELLRRNCRVGVDMEDWFSEDLLPDQRSTRPLRMLREAERSVLRDSAHSTCPSSAMSDALAREYDCRPPAVVYNAFPWSDRGRMDGQRIDRANPGLPSVHWVSQTLGPGRGLEDLLAALPLLTNSAQIHLRGRPVGGFAQWLGERLPEIWRQRVFVHDLVSNDDLLSRIAEHDIGFAGEQDFCRSRDLTVTNKILHYLLGGLAVVASATSGQREIAELAPGAVFLYPIRDCKSLAVRIDQLVGNPSSLAGARQAALAAAERTFCWEKQARTLVASVENAIASAANR